MSTSRDAVTELAREHITTCIHTLRGQRVMLDRDLAALYGVPTKALKQAVRRNPQRFPDDFMFLLTRKEDTNLRSQIVTSSSRNWGGQRAPALAFTEQGVAMLSSVLKSERAVRVNIAIMRTFVHLRQALATQAALARTLTELESRLGDHDQQIADILEAIRQLTEPPPPPPKAPIGFMVKEAPAPYGEDIRAMTIADYEPVVALWRTTPGVVVLPDVDSREGITRYLERNPGLSFIALAGDRCVGAVMSGHDGRRGYIHHLAVHPDSRRHGLGRRLAACCLEALKAEGILKVHLFVLATNTDGQAFWACTGWKRREDILTFSHSQPG